MNILNTDYCFNNNTFVSDMKISDINGDCFCDIVWLVGNKVSSDSSFIENIRLRIRLGKTCLINDFNLDFDSGYNPKLFLGDFTGNKVSNILVNIPAGGSGGYVYSYIFSYANTNIIELTSSEKIQEKLPLKIEFEDYYKVMIYNTDLNVSLTLDISDNKSIYNSNLYNSNGTLTAKTYGELLPLSGLYPIDVDLDGTFELMSIQRIIGRYNSETLGYIQGIWKFHKNQLNLIRLESINKTISPNNLIVY